MPAALQAADLVLCRSGASTLCELATLGKPGLLVPLPPAIGKSPQEANATMFERKRAGVVIKDADLEPKILAERVNYIMTSPELLAFMMEASRSLAKPQATQEIVDELVKLARIKVAQ
jgi:UDP-N-acetylglucosamine--N-acetylmuramyl-(pentapeptide) pyrophosphoryl-undecaprenol N-acetylglucosamine transferase